MSTVLVNTAVLQELGPESPPRDSTAQLAQTCSNRRPPDRPDRPVNQFNRNVSGKQRNACVRLAPSTLPHVNCGHQDDTMHDSAVHAPAPASACVDTLDVNDIVMLKS